MVYKYTSLILPVFIIVITERWDVIDRFIDNLTCFNIVYQLADCNIAHLFGVRPKACVMDTDGSLCIAKLPFRKDDYNADFLSFVEKMTGITVAEQGYCKPQRLITV